MSGQEANHRPLVPGSLSIIRFIILLCYWFFFYGSYHLLNDEKFNRISRWNWIRQYQIDWLEECADDAGPHDARTPNYTVDLSSLTCHFSMPAACAPIIKDLIERIGAEKIYEFYA